MVSIVTRRQYDLEFEDKEIYVEIEKFYNIYLVDFGIKLSK